MNDLVKDVAAQPLLYLNLPLSVKQNKDHGFMLAYVALHNMARISQSAVAEIYREIPLTLRNAPKERTREGLLYSVLDKVPELYSIAGASIKANNWLLVDRCTNVLGHWNMQAGQDDTWRRPFFLPAMPPLMRQCFTYFWHNPPPWLQSYYNDRRTDMKAETVPEVPEATAREWLLNDVVIGFAMLPSPAPQLIDDFEILEKHPSALCMIPDALLEERIDLINRMVQREGATYIKHLPPSFASAHLDGFLQILWERPELGVLDVRQIPTSVWLKAPQRVTDIVMANPKLYEEFEYAVRKEHPELIAHISLKDQYKYVPEEFKVGRWDLALAAVRADAQNWWLIPERFKDITWALNEQERDNVLELARLSLLEPKECYMSTDPLQFEMRNNNNNRRLSSVHEWHRCCRDMPAATRKALLEHLYYAKHHELLRCIGQFTTTKEMLQRKYDWQQRTIQGPLHSPWPSYLGTFLASKVMARVPKPFSDAHDYKRWARIEMRLIWLGLNQMLYSIRSNDHFFHANAEWVLQKIAQNIRRFCVNAWSTLDDELEIRNEREHVLYNYSSASRDDDDMEETLGDFIRRDEFRQPDYLAELLADPLALAQGQAQALALDPPLAQLQQNAFTNRVIRHMHVFSSIWIYACEYYNKRHKDDIWILEDNLQNFQEAVKKCLPPPTTNAADAYVKQVHSYLSQEGQVSFLKRFPLILPELDASL